MEIEFFLQIPDRLIEQGATLLDCRVYGNIKRQKNGCYASYATLAKWCNCERRSLIRSVNRLINMGWLVRQGQYIVPLTGGLASDQSVTSDPSVITSDQPVTTASDPSVTHINKISITKNYISKKTPSPEPVLKQARKKSCPDVLVTDEEFEKLKNEHYQTDLLNGRDLADAFLALQTYAVNEPKKFKKYKSHYLVLIGWVKDKVMQSKKAALALARETSYLESSLEKR